MCYWHVQIVTQNENLGCWKNPQPTITMAANLSLREYVTVAQTLRPRRASRVSFILISPWYFKVPPNPNKTCQSNIKQSINDVPIWAETVGRYNLNVGTYVRSTSFYCKFMGLYLCSTACYIYNVSKTQFLVQNVLAPRLSWSLVTIKWYFYCFIFW